MSVSVPEIARRLDQAAMHARAIPQFTGEESFDLDTAYAIQRANVEQRLARGEKPLGIKMGFTSRAKAVQMGVFDVICGRLTDGMAIEDGGRVARHSFVHPRVEPEIAFLLGRRLTGRLTPLQALDTVEAIAPALEIIDSRYLDFRFSLTDVVADNSSSARLVVGPWRRPDLDIANLGMIMSFDGRIEALGSSAAILGHPLRSLAAAARLAQERDIALEAGCIVLAGGATAASGLRAGLHVSLEVQSLGRTEFAVEE